MKHVERESGAPAAFPAEKAAERVPRRAIATQPRRTSYITFLLLAVALVSGTGWGLTAMFGARHTDRVNEEERSARAAAFAQIKPLTLKRVSVSEWNDALDSMKLSPAARAALLKDVAVPGSADVASTGAPRSAALDARAQPAEKQTLVWMTLWDTHAQDGDVVQIQSGGYQQAITLLNKPTRLAVPVPPGGVINIVGIHDGGGGITVGALSGDIPVALPIMSEGQSIGVPVAIP